MNRKIINKLVKSIITNRVKILDDFSKAYLAETKLKPSQVIMVEQRIGDTYTWSFRRKITKRIGGRGNLAELKEV